MTDLLDAANDYLSRGLRIIALVGKQPNGRVHPHGIHDAFDMASPVDEVSKAFSSTSLTTGVGILTKYPYFVVDIDGPDGAKAWLDIAGKEDYIPDRWVAKTGRGLHLWFADTTLRRSRKLAPLLDMKAEGGYVAAPPSKHPDGGTYEWLSAPGEDVPIEAPARLIRLLDEQDALQEQKLITREHRKRVRHAPRESGKWWASWGFEGLIQTVENAKPGERNSVLYWAAFTMVEDGADEEDFEQLREAAVKAGLTARETRLTVRSARRAASGG